MTQKYCCKALDKLMKDILKFSNPNSYEHIFGENLVILGGDFKQILPVISNRSTKK